MQTSASLNGSLRIVVVEDEGLIAEEIRDRLLRLSYQVVGVADTADEAIQTVERTRPHLVLMDIRLKGQMDGIEAAEYIYRNLQIPVVYLTAHSDQATLLRAKTAALFGYVVKPFQERDLLVAIEMATHRSELERRLNESRLNYTATLDSIADGVVAVTADGRVRFMNPVAEALTGWQLTEASGLPVCEVLRVVNPATQALVEHPVAQALRRQAVVRLRGPLALVSRQASAIPIEGSAAPIVEATGNLIGAVVTFRDITERQRADEALVAAREAWEQSFNALTDYICVLDRSGHILRANRAMRERFEPAHGSLIGMDCRQVYYGAAPPEPACATAMLGGTPIEIETTLPLLPGDFLLACFPLKDAAGAPSGAVHVVRDITQQRRLELQLRQSQKMQAIGQLAGGVAHDFNNLLTIISGYCDLLMLDVNDPSDALWEPVAGIRDASARAAQLTRQLLLLSRKTALDPQVLDLNDVLQGASKMLRRLIGEDLTFVTVLAPTLLRIRADRGQIEQVAINLCLNARDAMAQGGRLTIETRSVCFRVGDCLEHVDYRPGRFVQLTVSDTGCGMTPEVKAHLFEPFFTTKSSGRGTGLGLATVYGIVQQAGGFITVQSEAGVGTTFHIFLPVIDVAMAALPADADQPALVGTETVLLVEDEAGVRQIARRALDLHGYTVLEAPTGSEAIRLAEQHRGAIDLLVTDVVMPEMSGRQLAEELRARSRGLRVLFMSGYTDDAVIRHGIVAARDAFLQKPFTPSILARKVRDILDAHTV